MSCHWYWNDVFNMYLLL